MERSIQKGIAYKVPGAEAPGQKEIAPLFWRPERGGREIAGNEKNTKLRKRKRHKSEINRTNKPTQPMSFVQSNQKEETVAVGTVPTIEQHVSWVSSVMLAVYVSLSYDMKYSFVFENLPEKVGKSESWPGKQAVCL